MNERCPRLGGLVGEHNGYYTMGFARPLAFGKTAGQFTHKMQCCFVGIPIVPMPECSGFATLGRKRCSKGFRENIAQSTLEPDVEEVR